MERIYSSILAHAANKQTNYKVSGISTNLHVEFQNQKQFFKPGDCLRGNCVSKIRDIKDSNVSLTFKGIESVIIGKENNSGDGSHLIYHRESSQIFSTKKQLNILECVALNDEYAMYLFEFNIPKCPSSCSTSKMAGSGSINYSLVLNATHPIFTFKRQKIKIPIRIVAPIDLNTHYLEPFSQEATFEINWLFMNAGEILMDVLFNKRGYDLFEFIQIRIKIQNNSKIKIKDVEVSIIKRITINAQSHSTVTKYILHKVEQGITVDKDSQLITETTIQLPDNLDYTVYGQLVQVEYFAAFELSLPLFASSASMEIPIVFGSKS